MNDVRTATEIQKNEIPVTKMVKIGTHIGGKRIQGIMSSTNIFYK